MSDVQLWSRSFNYANLLLLFSIILTLIATGWVYVSASKVDKFRDAELARDRQADAAKIATANAEAARANEGVAKSTEGIAVAHVQIEEAKRDAADAYQQGQHAAASAEEAKAKQAELRKENIQLGTRLNEAVAESHTTKIELTKAQQKLAEAQAKQAEAQLALQQTLDKVKQNQEPRILTAQQVNKLSNSLKAIPSGRVSICCILGDSESKAFATQLDEIFRSSGWTTDGVSQGVFEPRNPVGLEVVVHSPDTVPYYAKALLDALNSAGLPTLATKDATVSASTLQLTVGVKPALTIK